MDSSAARCTRAHGGARRTTVYTAANTCRRGRAGRRCPERRTWGIPLNGGFPTVRRSSRQGVETTPLRVGGASLVCVRPGLQAAVAGPAAPILFFGDLDAYRTSPLRMLTVGLNPSLHEFPAAEPFRRFPLARDSLGREPVRYLDAMSAYFRTDPYRSWFGAFEPLLNGAGSARRSRSTRSSGFTSECSLAPTVSAKKRVSLARLVLRPDTLHESLGLDI